MFIKTYRLGEDCAFGYVNVRHLSEFFTHRHDDYGLCQLTAYSHNGQLRHALGPMETESKCDKRAEDLAARLNANLK